MFVVKFDNFKRARSLARPMGCHSLPAWFYAPQPHQPGCATQLQARFFPHLCISQHHDGGFSTAYVLIHNFLTKLYIYVKVKYSDSVYIVKIYPARYNRKSKAKCTAERAHKINMQFPED